MKTQPRPTSHNLADVDVVILAGGLGTRLRSVVSDRPKALADIGGRPFLDILIEQLSAVQAPRIVLSVGYLKEQIKAQYAKQGVFFAEEETPLGTGGGLKNAYQLLEHDRVLVMNGDSWFSHPIDLAAFQEFHMSKNALVSMLLSRPRSEKDYGAVLLADDSKIRGFNEKNQKIESEHFMNAGVYMMDKRAFNLMPEGAFSLENDFFPKLVGKNFYGFPIDAELVDIGTPERYANAEKIFFS
jgi:D-glycero-alpha-D-manno-heptose 1-phosphate guanylyltransferase